MVVGRHLVADKGTPETALKGSFQEKKEDWGGEQTGPNLYSLDSLRHHVGVMHGDQRHLHTGHLPQLGGPNACRKKLISKVSSSQSNTLITLLVS